MAERKSGTAKKTTRSKTTNRSRTATGATTQKTTRTRQTTRKPIAAAISDDQIRERAFYIYLSRHGAPGDEFSDWIQAERELRG